MNSTSRAGARLLAAGILAVALLVPTVSLAVTPGIPPSGNQSHTGGITPTMVANATISCDAQSSVKSISGDVHPQRDRRRRQIRRHLPDPEQRVERQSHRQRREERGHGQHRRQERYGELHAPDHGAVHRDDRRDPGGLREGRRRVDLQQQVELAQLFRGADADADGDADADPHRDADGHAHSDADGDAHGHADGHADRDADGHADAHAAATPTPRRPRRRRPRRPRRRPPRRRRPRPSRRRRPRPGRRSRSRRRARPRSPRRPRRRRAPPRRRRARRASRRRPRTRAPLAVPARPAACRSCWSQSPASSSPA